MAISLAQVRAAVSSQINTVSGMHLSNLPPQYFGRITDTIAHKAYAVDIASYQAIPERQRLSVGIYIKTSIAIKFAYRLRPHDVYPIDYDSSYDLAQEVIDAVLGDYDAIRQGLVGKFDSASATIPNAISYIIHTLNFTFLHTI